jgi:hypothetical protein
MGSSEWDIKGISIEEMRGDKENLKLIPTRTLSIDLLATSKIERP